MRVCVFSIEGSLLFVLRVASMLEQSIAMGVPTSANAESRVISHFSNSVFPFPQNPQPHPRAVAFEWRASRTALGFWVRLRCHYRRNSTASPRTDTLCRSTCLFVNRVFRSGITPRGSLCMKKISENSRWIRVLFVSRRRLCSCGGWGVHSKFKEKYEQVWVGVHRRVGIRRPPCASSVLGILR